MSGREARVRPGRGELRYARSGRPRRRSRSEKNAETGPGPLAQAAWESVMNAPPVDASRGQTRRRVSDYAPDETPAPVTVPGLNLAFTADSMVSGVIFSEILTRRQNGRSYRRA